MAFLESENKAAGSEAYNKLKTSLTNYLSIFNEFSEGTIDNFIEKLRNGGQEAVDIALKISESQGKELSAQDVETIYRSQIS